MDFNKMAAFSRLQKYLNTSTSELSLEMVKDIATAFGKEVDVTDQTVASLVQLARENNVDKLADVLGQPEMMKKVMTIVMAPPPSAQEDDAMIVCPHCAEYICLNR